MFLHTGKKPGTFPETKKKKGKVKKKKDAYSRNRISSISCYLGGKSTDTHSNSQPGWRSSCTSRGRYFDRNIINIKGWQTTAKLPQGGEVIRWLLWRQTQQQAHPALSRDAGTNCPTVLVESLSPSPVHFATRLQK